MFLPVCVVWCVLAGEKDTGFEVSPDEVQHTPVRLDEQTDAIPTSSSSDSLSFSDEPDARATLPTPSDILVSYSTFPGVFFEIACFSSLVYKPLLSVWVSAIQKIHSYYETAHACLCFINRCQLLKMFRIVWIFVMNQTCNFTSLSHDPQLLPEYIVISRYLEHVKRFCVCVLCCCSVYSL